MRRKYLGINNVRGLEESPKEASLLKGNEQDGRRGR